MISGSTCLRPLTDGYSVWAIPSRRAAVNLIKLKMPAATVRSGWVRRSGIMWNPSAERFQAASVDSGNSMCKGLIVMENKLIMMCET
jgi:hypothetical protein